MANLAAWFASLVPGLVARVMLALGFGVLTVTGVNLAWDQIKAAVIANFGAAPAAMTQLAGLSGAGDAIAVILGAISARVALYVATKGARIVGLPS